MTKKDKKGMQGLRQTPRDRKGENQRTNREIDTLPTRKILAHVYTRHDTGIWIFISLMLGVSLAVALTS